MAASTSEFIRLKSLLGSLGVFHNTPMRLYCDSLAALHIAHNPVFHERTKHIEIDCHFVREKLTASILTLSHVSTKQQPADLFTKALGSTQFQFLKDKLDILDLYAPT